MYKVVLIDDEKIIVDGLSKVMPWKKYNSRVVAKGYSVSQGIKLINEHKPDILFTDIRMPDGDGLVMLAGLKSEHPKMQVTVLTGYRDFDYAREAIHLGVNRFLLKPSKMDELEEALKIMTNTLEKEKNNTISEEKPEEKEDNVTNFLVREAVLYIEKNYNKKISLEDVADACFVSQWHLSKLLQKHTQESFYDILNKTRILKAKEHLKNPSLKIGKIAERVGYSSTSHFSRVFKKFEKMTPNEYRNEITKT